MFFPQHHFPSICIADPHANLSQRLFFFVCLFFNSGVQGEGSYPTVVIGVKFVSTFVDWGDQSLVPNIGDNARAKDDVKEF